MDTKKDEFIKLEGNKTFFSIMKIYNFFCKPIEERENQIEYEKMESKNIGN